MKLAVPAVAMLLVAAMVFAACGSSREADVMQASRSPGGTRIVLEIATCNADLSSRVEETERQVRVLVTARNDTSDDCADGHTIILSEPLDNRLLIDEFDGEPVAVSLGRWIPDAP